MVDSSNAPSGSVTSILDTHSHLIVVVPDGCWVWVGATDIGGYGRVGGKAIGEGSGRAHRFSYEMARGPIPEGLDLDHLCRQRNCVNPQHLEAVTRAENLIRGRSVNLEKTHCPSGHPYSDENTYVTKDGWRDCVECQRNRSREWYILNRSEVLAKAQRRRDA